MLCAPPKHLRDFAMEEVVMPGLLSVLRWCAERNIYATGHGPIVPRGHTVAIPEFDRCPATPRVPDKAGLFNEHILHFETLGHVDRSDMLPSICMVLPGCLPVLTFSNLPCNVWPALNEYGVWPRFLDGYTWDTQVDTKKIQVERRRIQVRIPQDTHIICLAESI